MSILFNYVIIFFSSCYIVTISHVLRLCIMPLYTQQYTAYIYSHPEVDRIWNVQRYSICLVICLLNILPSGK